MPELSESEEQVRSGYQWGKTSELCSLLPVLLLKFFGYDIAAAHGEGLIHT